VTSKITAAADAALLANQPGEGEADWQPTGLFNDTTVPVSPDTYGDPNKPSDGFNAVSNAITRHRGQRRQPQTNIVMNPTGMAGVHQRSGTPTGGPSSANQAPPSPDSSGECPSTVTSHAPEGKLLVLDKTAIISATGGVTLAKSGEAKLHFRLDHMAHHVPPRMEARKAQPHAHHQPRRLARALGKGTAAKGFQAS
jgi:hypothetical protein